MAEHWWRDRYNAIAEQGYMLRPQYHPQWGSSWSKDVHTTDHGQTQATIVRIIALVVASFLSCPIDYQSKLGAAMDANRIQDSLPVILKKVLPNEAPHELRINRLFSSPELSRNPDNHCAPLLGVMTLPAHFGSQELMVFPLLRPFNRPQIQTFTKFCAFFTQICEVRLNITPPCDLLTLLIQGIRFMHQRNVAHRYDPYDLGCRFESNHLGSDCTIHNIKVVVQRRRSSRYYFIDFGLSRQYPSRDVMDEPLPGRDESAPEHQSRRRRPCNPFHTDIYYIGHVVRNEFMEVCDRVANFH